MSVSEPVPEYKVSVVREAIEAGMEYLVDEPTTTGGVFPYVWHPAFVGSYAHDVYAKLRAAWLSLEKCAVCGRQDVICQLLHYEELPVPEDLCEACRPLAHYAGLGKYEHEVYPF